MVAIEQCNMQQTLRLGQVAQPSVVAQVAAAVKSLKRKKQAWCARMAERTAQNEFLCVIGIPLLFEPVAQLLWAVALGFVLLCGVAGWLEGGAV